MTDTKTAKSREIAVDPMVPGWVQIDLNMLVGLFDGVLLVGERGRIEFWNRGAERITGFRASEVLGRECCEVIRHHDYRGDPLCPRGECPVQSDKPLEGVREALVYVQHRRGDRIPVIARTSTIVGRDGYRGMLEIFSDSRLGMVPKKHFDELKRLALLDSLTGLGNRRYGEAILSMRLQDRRGQGEGMGVLLADLDYFKQVNDVYGHHAGDAVLRAVGKIFSSGLRSVDTVARWGGEEFLFIFSDIKPRDLAVVAEKLRMEVEAAGIRWKKKTLKITVSLGGTVVEDGDSREAVLERADTHLYTSKRLGRNRVSLDPPPVGPKGSGEG